MRTSTGRRLQDHPQLLLWAYRLMHRLLVKGSGPLARIGNERLARWIRGPEEVAKRWVFDCRMCGQCVLHATGMTCPMTCPKSLRNGPCGGVRSDGGCEVLPSSRCIWVDAELRARSSGTSADLAILQPPLDHQLQDTSAWVNLLTAADRPRWPGWNDSDRDPRADV